MTDGVSQQGDGVKPPSQLFCQEAPATYEVLTAVAAGMGDANAECALEMIRTAALERIAIALDSLVTLRHQQDLRTVLGNDKP